MNNKSPASLTTSSQATARRVRPPAVRDGPLSVLMLLVGVWLYLCLWVLPYPETTRGPHLVEVGASVIVTITAVVRLSHPRGRSSDLLVLLVGAGLIIAAFFGGYDNSDATAVIGANQVASGSALILLALCGMIMLARDDSAAEPDRRDPPG
ncbi:SPW repeat domain-containing protein [Streptomyces sediminimaris]|uniref:SPW repeat domain-containing protein n=1 Tax=Streptomyces sediminimaris TaxID=3383721 RepID=UPI00399BAE91